MRRRLSLPAGIVLILLLAWEPATSAQRETGVGAPASLSLCGPSIPEQPIPDDGHWLQVCLLDPLAPEGTTVTHVHLKYLIEHPDPNQLEVRLRREDVGIEQIVWEQGKAIPAGEFGRASDLKTFRGTPSQGQWHLWIRDAVLGQSGWLKAASLAVEYAPVGLLPTLLSGTAGRPTSYRLPVGVLPSQTPDRDQKKTESEGMTPLSASGWQEIKRETFEGVFPNAGWTLIDANPNDGKEYLWDDDDYRRHGGYWAAWPANG